MRIMGAPTATSTTVRKNMAALGVGTLFTNEMFPPIWHAAQEAGIDPVILTAQAGKETGWGRFGRATTPDHHNTCGLKIKKPEGLADDDPNAHQRFPNWRVGATAHAQHLRAYCGVYYPEYVAIHSPRYPIVVSLGLKITDIEQLGSGRWAPSTTYGAEVAATAKRLALV
jgi:hypothetical protein